jgi:glyoxylate/hydroxypyruvate reductase A
MSVNILFAGKKNDWPAYEVALKQELETRGIDANLAVEMAAQDVDYLVYAPSGPVQDFTPFTKARAVLGLWAGVESVISNPTLTLPYTRMVDAGLREGMREWVTGHVLRHHLGMDQDILNVDATWGRPAPPLARDRSVGILGLGALGATAAKSLAALNFKTYGWSRTPKDIDGVTCFYGAQGLRDILGQCEILVLLTPLTDETQDLLNAQTLSYLPKGGVVINPGRGALIDDQALLAALDSGQISHATLDVFRNEPLPKTDPYWTHPNVTVTPHIASETRPSSAAQVICENIARDQAGVPMLHLVDKNLGY